jgi:hypothetical protein
MDDLKWDENGDEDSRGREKEESVRKRVLWPVGRRRCVVVADLGGL